MTPLTDDSRASDEILEQAELLAEIHPGVFRPLVQRVDIPRYIVSEVVSNGDGTYRVEPITEFQGWMKAADVEAEPNLPNISGVTLRRLIQAGFIDGAQITPGIWYLKLDSLFAHIERTTCASMDESWWTDARRAAFRDAR